MASIFLDYNSQIQNLKNKNLIINNDLLAIEILQRTSYYGLINGYKTAFIDPTTNRYINGTTFDDIYQIYL
ncbi:MAG: Abi family protein, partial [Lachnospiraceae bacterium]|nr:Abi family protein [Lachnospiraceae bacterium]